MEEAALEVLYLTTPSNVKSWGRAISPNCAGTECSAFSPFKGFRRNIRDMASGCVANG